MWSMCGDLPRRFQVTPPRKRAQRRVRGTCGLSAEHTCCVSAWAVQQGRRLTLRACAYVLRRPAVQALTLRVNTLGTVHEPGEEVVLPVDDRCCAVRSMELLCLVFFFGAQKRQSALMMVSGSTSEASGDWTTRGVMTPLTHTPSSSSFVLLPTLLFLSREVCLTRSTSNLPNLKPFKHSLQKRSLGCRKST